MAGGKGDIYVLYVGTGNEDGTSRLIRKLVEDEAFDEVFSPTFEKRIKRAGTWRTVEAQLIPGYLFIVTRDMDLLRKQLWSVPALTKLLTMGDQFVPLGPDETEWLDQLTHPFERTVGFSEGYIVGDRVVITAGPLMGHESEIIKIDRRKRFGYLRFSVMGREKDIKVGLEIVRKVAGDDNACEPPDGVE